MSASASRILSETTLSLAQAAARLPSFRLGKPVNASTVWRWINDGVKLPDGTTVRLEAVRLAGRWLTSAEALARFADAQTPHAKRTAELPPRIPQRHRSDFERAERELVSWGL
jgi:hypothetical protein